MLNAQRIKRRCAAVACGYAIAILVTGCVLVKDSAAQSASESTASSTTENQAAPSSDSTTAAQPAAEPAQASAEADFPRVYDPTELYPRINVLMRGDRNYDEGLQLFQQLSCGMCHRFGGGSGGIGPDITGVGGRFDTRELLESIIQPSAVISDLYGTKDIYLKDGSWVTGRVIGESATDYTVSKTWQIDPATGTSAWTGDIVKIPYTDVDWVEDSWVSPMPEGFLSALTEDQIANFCAFLISGGDPNNNMFKPKEDTTASGNSSTTNSVAASSSGESVN